MKSKPDVNVAHDSAYDAFGISDGFRFYSGFGKRAFDLFFVVLTAPITLPVILVLALIVKLDGGPAFFGHLRLGKDGRPFRCWKIRTMVPDAEKVLQELLARNPAARAEWEREFKLDDDPRITRIGSFLRKTSLDELPQFFNVLIGDMSVIGPRPVTAKEIEMYGSASRITLSVRPGLSGMWQVSGRNAVDYAARIALDLHYVRQMSFRQDITIIIRTIVTMLRRTGK